MKHIFSFLLFLLLIALPCVYADEEKPDGGGAKSPFGGAIELVTGVYFGGMNEYVFIKGRDHELSRLEWEENFVPYIDVRGQFDFWNFFAAVSLSTSIPVRSGVMRDYDFILPNNNAVSHYSEHDALFDKHLEINPEIGWGSYIGRRWYLGASAGFLYRNRKWTAAGGYTQYPPLGEPWSASLPKEKQAGTVITYEESLWAPELTLYVDFFPNERFVIEAVSSWYPYLDITTIDTHILRRTRFRDKMQGGWGTLAEINMAYHPKTSNIVAFRLGFGYEGIFSARGSAATGGLGSDTWLGIDPDIESQIKSNLFWVHVGFCIYPDRLFTTRK